MKETLLFLYLFSHFLTACEKNKVVSASSELAASEQTKTNQIINFLSLDTLDNYTIIKDTNNGFINIYQIPNTEAIIFTDSDNQNTVFKYDLINHKKQDFFNIKSRSTPIQEYTHNLEKQEYCFCDTYTESKDYGVFFTYDYKANLISQHKIKTNEYLHDIKMTSCIKLNDEELLIHYSEYITSNNPQTPFIKSKERYKRPIASIYNLNTQKHENIPISYPHNYNNNYDYTGLLDPILLNNKKILFHFPANDSVFIYDLQSKSTSVHLMDIKDNFIRPYSNFSPRNMTALSQLKSYGFYCNFTYLPLHKIYIRKLLFIDEFLDINAGEYKYAFYSENFEYIGETSVSNHMDFYEDKDNLYFLAYGTLTKFSYKKIQSLQIDKTSRDISLDDLKKQFF